MISAFGMVSGNLYSLLEKTRITTKIELLQKAALLGTARLLKRVLEA